MDSKYSQITVGELLDHPGARTVLQHRLLILVKHPMLEVVRIIILEQILSVAQTYVLQKKVDEIPSELRRAQMQERREWHAAVSASPYASRR